MFDFIIRGKVFQSTEIFIKIGLFAVGQSVLQGKNKKVTRCFHIENGKMERVMFFIQIVKIKRTMCVYKI